MPIRFHFTRPPSRVQRAAHAMQSILAARRTGDVSIALSDLEALLADDARITFTIAHGVVSFGGTKLFEHPSFGTRSGTITIDRGVTSTELAHFARALGSNDAEAAAWALGRTRIRLRWARRRTEEVDALREALVSGAVALRLRGRKLEDLQVSPDLRIAFRNDLDTYHSDASVIAHLARVLVSALRRAPSHQTGSLRRVLPKLHRRLVATGRIQEADSLVRRVARCRRADETAIEAEQTTSLLAELAQTRAPSDVTRVMWSPR